MRDSYATEAGGGLNNADIRDYEWPSGDPPIPIVLAGGRVEIVDSIFTGNGSGGTGAAINNVSSGSITISGGSEISLNPGPIMPDPLEPLESVVLVDAGGDYPIGPSAITNMGEWDEVGTIRIVDSSLVDNTSEENGGAIQNAGDGIIVVEDTLLKKNRSEASGGALYAEGGTVRIVGGTVAENYAANGGGLYSGGSPTSFGLRGRFEVSGTQITDNEAEANGGGMSSGGDGQVFVTDVTFDGNYAGDSGAGVENGDRASLAVVDSMFTHNRSVVHGAGMTTHSERAVSIDGSTFADNEAGITVTEGLEPGELPEIGDGFGGGLATDGGRITITNSGFERNLSSDDGAGIAFHGAGTVVLADSTIQSNEAKCEECSGGGIEYSGMRGTFERVTVKNNKALTGNGGGIHNTGSDELTILDSHVEGNTALNGGGLAIQSDAPIVVKGSLFLNNGARAGRDQEGLLLEESGRGGGIFSISDSGSLIENTTISGNFAKIAGGGLHHDADGELRLVHNTIWRNAAPTGGGVSVVESDFVPSVPPQPHKSLFVKNSIIGGSVSGGSCDYFVTTEGGNVDTGKTCFLEASPEMDINPISRGVRDFRGLDPKLDAIADNGGATLTHRLNYGSIAIDASAAPCAILDQRGVDRPQNGRCDAGAYEFEGPPPPFDETPPDTEFISGPIQDSIETAAFRFTGEDNLTPLEELQFECRLIENELTEAPEPTPPWEPIEPEFIWYGCSSPWSVPLMEEGLFTFEVRAVDRSGNVDPTPVSMLIDGTDLTPPDTFIVEKPPLVSTSRAAVFTFSGGDPNTPTQFLEYECRLDSRDPEMWLECFNPAVFSNLTTGSHTLEVRAVDGNENIDPTPARYTWTVGLIDSGDPGAPVNCDNANITLTAAADGWADEVNPIENYLFETELEVRSGSTGDPAAGEQVIGQNARSFFRFPLLPENLADCTLESATLRLYAGGFTEGRDLVAVPLAETWKESTLTWSNQPDPLTGVTTATTPQGEGYREFDVLDHVQSMFDLGVHNGWVIRDAHEGDPEGGDTSFESRETPQDPPDMTLPLLELRFQAEATPPPAAPVWNNPPPTEHACGDVITENTLLKNDITGCLGEGLIIGASNIILDLNGKMVRGGLILEPGEEDALQVGIRSSKPNVIIRNGTVENFGYGVMLTPGAIHDVVENMNLRRNAIAGVQLFDADDGRSGTTIRNNTISENGESGVQLVSGTENSLVEGNTFTSNGTSVLLQDARGNTIRDNEISGIVLDPALDSDAGIVLELGSRSNVLADNNVSDTGDAGIVIHQGSHGNRVEGGKYFRNGDAGVIVNDSDRTTIIGITAAQESDGGVVLNNAHFTVVQSSDLRYNPAGIEAGNTNNLVVGGPEPHHGNDASHSLQTGFQIGEGVGITIQNNTANLTGGAGIGVESAVFDAAGSAVGGAFIADNTTNENAEAGISVEVARHTIARNRAYNNAGYGIAAGEEPSAGEPLDPNANIDGGGNRASGNHADVGIAVGPPDAVQCLGVVCDTSDTAPITGIDLTAPTTTIVSGPPPDTSSETAVFTFTGADNFTGPNGLIFECRLDPPPDPVFPPLPPDLEPPEPGPPDVDTPPEPENWHECASPMTYQFIEPGEHHFEVRAHDEADNFDATPATYDWVINPGAPDGDLGPDLVAPDTRLAAAPAAITTNRNATFRFAGSDNMTPGLNLEFQCATAFDPDVSPENPDFDPVWSAWAPCVTPTSFANLPYGGHWFQVRAIDRAGNTDATPAVHGWWVQPPPPDSVPPETTIHSGPDQITVETSGAVTFSGSDNQSTAEELTYECRLNGAMTGSPSGPVEHWTSCTAPHLLTALAPQQHLLQVRAVDLALNADPTPAAHVWTVGPAPVERPVFCGMTITASTIVNNNLTDCLGHGLIIGASGITIDLNGKIIDGKDLGAGIMNNGFDHVTIKNGRLTGFDYGVMLNKGTQFNVVDGVTAQLNQEAGVGLGQPPAPLDPNAPNIPEEPPPGVQSQVKDNIVRGSTLVGNKRGVWIANEAQRTLVTQNMIGASASEGVWIERASLNRVVGNDIQASGDAGVVLQGSDENSVVDNVDGRQRRRRLHRHHEDRHGRRRAFQRQPRRGQLHRRERRACDRGHRVERQRPGRQRRE